MFNKRQKYCNIDQINNVLSYCYEYKEIHFRQRQRYEPFGRKAFITDKIKILSVECIVGGKPIEYLFDKSTGDTENHPQITGAQAFNVLNRYVKVNKVIEDKKDAPFSAKAILWKNPKYEGKRVNAIGYDMNSAYSYAMIQSMPDTSVPPKQKIIENGEIGFDLNGNRKTYGYSLYVFKLIESPFKRFVETYYNRKKNAKTKAEKRRYKEYLNFTVGFLQLRDPFTRAQIIGIANDKIKSLIDENTLYCNTDSIVSLTERPELELGEDLGQWKIEHRGQFAYKSFNYQWNLEVPTFRGKVKTDFYKGWDLLKDELPICGNKYYFNSIKGAVVECED